MKKQDMLHRASKIFMVGESTEIVMLTDADTAVHSQNEAICMIVNGKSLRWDGTICEWIYWFHSFDEMIEAYLKMDKNNPIIFDPKSDYGAGK